MKLFAGTTIKGLAIALAIAALALVATNVAWWAHSATLEAGRDTAKADLSTRTTERNAWKQRAGELKAANTAYDAEFARLAQELRAAQAERSRLEKAGAEALAAAEAAEADATRTLHAFMDRYATQMRAPDCASAMASVQRFCPALEGY